MKLTARAYLYHRSADQLSYESSGELITTTSNTRQCAKLLWISNNSTCQHPTLTCRLHFYSPLFIVLKSFAIDVSYRDDVVWTNFSSRSYLVSVGFGGISSCLWPSNLSLPCVDARHSSIICEVDSIYRCQVLLKWSASKKKQSSIQLAHFKAVSGYLFLSRLRPLCEEKILSSNEGTKEWEKKIAPNSRITDTFYQRYSAALCLLPDFDIVGVALQVPPDWSPDTTAAYRCRHRHAYVPQPNKVRQPREMYVLTSRAPYPVQPESLELIAGRAGVPGKPIISIGRYRRQWCAAWQTPCKAKNCDLHQQTHCCTLRDSKSKLEKWVNALNWCHR